MEVPVLCEVINLGVIMKVIKTLFVAALTVMALPGVVQSATPSSRLLLSIGESAAEGASSFLLPDASPVEPVSVIVITSAASDVPEETKKLIKDAIAKRRAAINLDKNITITVTIVKTSGVGYTTTQILLGIHSNYINQKKYIGLRRHTIPLGYLRLVIHQKDGQPPVGDWDGLNVTMRSDRKKGYGTSLILLGDAVFTALNVINRQGAIAPGYGTTTEELNRLYRRHGGEIRDAKFTYNADKFLTLPLRSSL